MGLLLILLLTAGTLLAQQAGDGSTPLLRAAYADNLTEADRLLRSGAAVNSANDLGATPLWAAAQNGSAAMVKRLLAAGANPNLALLAGETPLMVAARGGFVDVVNLLIAKDANLNARGARGQTALMWSAAQKHSAVVKTLVAHRADLTLKSEVWNVVEAVPPHGELEYNKAIPHGGDTALLFAARSADFESARILVEAGANINDADAWGVSATAMAAHAGATDLAVYLLEKGANPNTPAPGFTPLHTAIMRRDEKLVAALLAHGADANARITAWTPTRRSSKDYNFEPALIGASPFWLAARMTEPGIMMLLLRHGADPKFVHKAEYIAGTSYQRRRESTNALLAAVGLGAADVWFPLSRAERETRTLAAVKIAVEQGIDVNIPANDGRTALDAAGVLRFPAVVEFLTSKGARAGSGAARSQQ